MANSLNSDVNNDNRNDSPSLSNLILNIAQSASDPLIIEATITNTHSTAPFTILKWDTPLDSQAFSHGVFSINRLGDEDNKMYGRQIRAKRKMPPLRSKLVEIGPRDSVTKQLKIPTDQFPLEGGQMYKIRAKGFYKAVWPVKIEDITDADLMGGSRRGMSGDFESNEADLLAP